MNDSSRIIDYNCVRFNFKDHVMKGIFINYRREDSIGYAGRIYDRISTRFGKERVFMDIDTISPGDDFRQTIEHTCASSAVVLALMAKSWATLTDKSGRRRLDNPRDFVRLELARALATNIRVIPVLLDEAEMPDPDSLPEDLKDLAYRHALQISSLRFHHDIDRMIEILDKVLAKVDANEAAAESKSKETKQESRPPGAAQERREEAVNRSIVAAVLPRVASTSALNHGSTPELARSA